MIYNKLGNTDLEVSEICLGTMTFGEQNSEAEGHSQMDYALDHGVNFFDTAELYAVPSTPENNGKTEDIVGTWFSTSKKRDKIILATKVTGPSPNLTYISNNLGFSRKRIIEAVNRSLRRLQTDYIDLYQLHWPERKTNMFGQSGLLSGKYHRGDDDASSRRNKFKQMSRYDSKQCFDATEKYLELADSHALSLAQMSLAYINSRDFVTSNIIGATNLDQLKENIESSAVKLSKEVVDAIEKIHNEIPNPAP